jgi:hypothetical protein
MWFLQTAGFFFRKEGSSKEYFAPLLLLSAVIGG